MNILISPQKTCWFSVEAHQSGVSGEHQHLSEVLLVSTHNMNILVSPQKRWFSVEAPQSGVSSEYPQHKYYSYCYTKTCYGNSLEAPRERCF